MFILRHSDLRDFFANAAWKGKIRKREVVPIKNKNRHNLSVYT